MAFFLEMKSTYATPYVLIDEKKHYMKMEGMCFHENIIDFFKDIIHWLESYLDSDIFEKLVFDCNVRYFNSSSSKILFDMFYLMNSHALDGKDIVVNWIMNKDDDMLAELYSEIENDYTNLTFHMVFS